MINADLFGISLTIFYFFFISDGPEVPFYFFFTTIIFELSTIIFYIKSNVMPFSAFKLKKTYWQKTIWPPALKGLEEQYVLEMSPWKTKITDGCHIDLNHSVKHSLWPGKCFQKGRYVRKGRLPAGREVVPYLLRSSTLFPITWKRFGFLSSFSR